MPILEKDIMETFTASDIARFAPFQEICRKICLNIPEYYQWQWDRQRQLALMTMEKSDAEMVYFPLFKEFKEHWSFASGSNAEMIIARLINAAFGLLPGQTFFASSPIDSLFLFVAWWPWGDTPKVSMRVGLFPTNSQALHPEFTYACLSRWLNLTA